MRNISSLRGKEWWQHCTTRLQEQGYSEERARRICGWVFYHHLKPYPPEKEEKNKQEGEETGEDIISRIYSKIARGEELTEDEKKILAAYLEAKQPDKEEEKEKDVTIPVSANEIARIILRYVDEKDVGTLTADEVKTLARRYIGIDLSDKEADRIMQEIQGMVKKQISIKELRKILEEVKKVRRKDKPYTREARRRKRMWLQARGR